ncbi:GNAT family N-acetyltransferase [Streptomyces nigrescens]|uniref:GNAT family N-acetyltransferase n=1 Tax=Streptomyces nigrescens TaxID=1920 RepID=UPI003697FD79
MTTGNCLAHWKFHCRSDVASSAALVETGRRMPGIDRIEIHHDEANPASGAVARRLGFTEMERVQVPEGPVAPSETGIDVIWRLQTSLSPSA